MARPSLFVRALEQSEMEFLAHPRKSRRQAVRQRAQILPASLVYTPVSQIALICQTDEAHVRRVIPAFNAFGFERLNPKVGTSRPRTFEPATRDRSVAIALTPPTSLSEPLTHWSLRRLTGYLERRRVVGRVSIETLRRILRERKVTFQRTRSWKCSTDPQFEAKTTRIMALCRTCPADGVVVCFDEFGPISLQAWAEAHNVELVATPTSASHLNRIECHFRPLREFVLNASDYASHPELAVGFRGYLHRRNADHHAGRIRMLESRSRVA